MLPEIWKPVPSIPGLLASSRGRIMTKPHERPMPHGGLRRYGGYAHRGVWSEGKRYTTHFRGRTYRVARLVCEAFHGPAPADKPVCMHLDENSRNNAPSNLRWGTQKENLNAPGFLEYCRGRTGDNSPTAKSRKVAA